MATIEEKIKKYSTFIEENSKINLGVDVSYAKRAKEDLKNHEIPTDDLMLVSGKSKDFIFALMNK